MTTTASRAAGSYDMTALPSIIIRVRTCKGNRTLVGANAVNGT